MSGSCSEESGALVTDMPEVSPQSEAFGSLDAAEPSLPQGTGSTDDRRQGSRSVTPDLQHPDEFRLSSPSGPAAPQPAAASRPPLPIPERVGERYDSNPYLSLPRSGSRGDPVLTDFRPKPVSYENAELTARLSPPYLDSTGDSSGGDVVRIGRSFHDMDPAEIDFDTRQAYQSLGDLALPNKYEKVPPAIDGVYSIPRPLPYKHKHSPTVPTILCCALVLSVLALVIAVGGTSIAVYNLLEAPESTTSEVEKLELQLKASQSMIVLLNGAVEELRHEMALLSARTQNESQELYLALLTSRGKALSEVRQEVDAVALAVDGILDPNRTTRIQELHPYQNCTTSIITECSITSGLLGDLPSFAVCETPLVPRSRVGYQNLDLRCSVVDTQSEEDPIITTPIVDESKDEVGCLCYVTAFSSGVNQVHCGMYATRCLKSVYLDTLIKLP